MVQLSSENCYLKKSFGWNTEMQIRILISNSNTHFIIMQGRDVSWFYNGVIYLLIYFPSRNTSSAAFSGLSDSLPHRILLEVAQRVLPLRTCFTYTSLFIVTESMFKVFDFCIDRMLKGLVLLLNNPYRLSKGIWYLLLLTNVWEKVASTVRSLI